MKNTYARILLAALVGVLAVSDLTMAQAEELATAKVAVGQSKKPNIVFILADNVGWGDFGVYGGTTATPRIDALATALASFAELYGDQTEEDHSALVAAIQSGRVAAIRGTE